MLISIVRCGAFNAPRQHFGRVGILLPNLNKILPKVSRSVLVSEEDEILRTFEDGSTGLGGEYVRRLGRRSPIQGPIYPPGKSGLRRDLGLNIREKIGAPARKGSKMYGA